MITLYHSPMTRSGSILWLLEELQVPYETKQVSFRRVDGTGEKDPVNPHPHGKVPALQDGNDMLFESSAIALYLTDKYRKVPMGPTVGDPKRAEYLSWLAYRPGVMEPALISRRLEHQHVNGMMGWAAADEVEEVLNAQLEGRKYFLGGDFSALDILIGGGIYFMLQAQMMAETSVLQTYTARIVERPAFKKMLAT